MKKAECIKRYGEAAYGDKLQQVRDWRVQHPKELKAGRNEWVIANPNKLKTNHQEHCRKGGKHYEHYLVYNKTGLRGERNCVRKAHRYRWHPFKQIIAPGSQIHHEWIPGTTDFRGVALVEADQHMHGYIDVIQVLDGEITLLTEAEIKGGG